MFPQYTGTRCLMMPYIQGDPDSVPPQYRHYADVIAEVYLERGSLGFLTIDESVAQAGTPHRGERARYSRALHTEAGKRDNLPVWGGGGWGKTDNVVLERDVQILLANSLDNTCAVWDAVHEDTTQDGDLGHLADQYPYGEAKMLRANEVVQIGIFTPHESLPVRETVERQFLRIVSSGVWGREPYFTRNPLMEN